MSRHPQAVESNPAIQSIPLKSESKRQTQQQPTQFLYLFDLDGTLAIEKEGVEGLTYNRHLARAILSKAAQDKKRTGVNPILAIFSARNKSSVIDGVCNDSTQFIIEEFIKDIKEFGLSLDYISLSPDRFPLYGTPGAAYQHQVAFERKITDFKKLNHTFHMAERSYKDKFTADNQEITRKARRSRDPIKYQNFLNDKLKLVKLKYQKENETNPIEVRKLNTEIDDLVWNLRKVKFKSIGKNFFDLLSYENRIDAYIKTYSHILKTHSTLDELINTRDEKKSELDKEAVQQGERILNLETKEELKGEALAKHNNDIFKQVANKTNSKVSQFNHLIKHICKDKQLDSTRIQAVAIDDRLECYSESEAKSDPVEKYESALRPKLIKATANKKYDEYLTEINDGAVGYSFFCSIILNGYMPQMGDIKDVDTSKSYDFTSVFPALNKNLATLSLSPMGALTITLSPRTNFYCFKQRLVTNDGKEAFVSLYFKRENEKFFRTNAALQLTTFFKIDPFEIKNLKFDEYPVAKKQLASYAIKDLIRVSNSGLLVDSLISRIKVDPLLSDDDYRQIFNKFRANEQSIKAQIVPELDNSLGKNKFNNITEVIRLIRFVYANNLADKILQDKINGVLAWDQNAIEKNNNKKLNDRIVLLNQVRQETAKSTNKPFKLKAEVLSAALNLSLNVKEPKEAKEEDAELPVKIVFKLEKSYSHEELNSLIADNKATLDKEIEIFNKVLGKEDKEDPLKPEKEFIDILIKYFRYAEACHSVMDLKDEEERINVVNTLMNELFGRVKGANLGEAFKKKLKTLISGHSQNSAMLTIFSAFAVFEDNTSKPRIVFDLQEKYGELRNKIALLLRDQNDPNKNIECLEIAHKLIKIIDNKQAKHANLGTLSFLIKQCLPKIIEGLESNNKEHLLQILDSLDENYIHDCCISDINEFDLMALHCVAGPKINPNFLASVVRLKDLAVKKLSMPVESQCMAPIISSIKQAVSVGNYQKLQELEAQLLYRPYDYLIDVTSQALEEEHRVSKEDPEGKPLFEEFNIKAKAISYLFDKKKSTYTSGTLANEEKKWLFYKLTEVRQSLRNGDAENLNRCYQELNNFTSGELEYFQKWLLDTNNEVNLLKDRLRKNLMDLDKRDNRKFYNLSSSVLAVCDQYSSMSCKYKESTLEYASFMHARKLLIKNILERAQDALAIKDMGAMKACLQDLRAYSEADNKHSDQGYVFNLVSLKKNFMAIKQPELKKVLFSIMNEVESIRKTLNKNEDYTKNMKLLSETLGFVSGGCLSGDPEIFFDKFFTLNQDNQLLSKNLRSQVKALEKLLKKHKKTLMSELCAPYVEEIESAEGNRIIEKIKDLNEFIEANKILPMELEKDLINYQEHLGFYEFLIKLGDEVDLSKIKIEEIKEYRKLPKEQKENKKQTAAEMLVNHAFDYIENTHLHHNLKTYFNEILKTQLNKTAVPVLKREKTPESPSSPKSPPLQYSRLTGIWDGSTPNRTQTFFRGVRRKSAERSNNTSPFTVPIPTAPVPELKLPNLISSQS